MTDTDRETWRREAQEDAESKYLESTAFGIAAQRILALLDALAESESAARLLSDLQEEYPEVETKAECDDCRDCGEHVMCARHSFISALHRSTWTTGQIERNALRAALTAKDEALTSVSNAAKVLVAGADRRVLAATEHEPAARAAIATLDSEREMNAKLTEELERAEAESARLTAQVARLERDLAGARAESDGRRHVLMRKAEEARAHWIRAEAAEAQVARLTERLAERCYCCRDRGEHCADGCGCSTPEPDEAAALAPGQPETEK